MFIMYHLNLHYPQRNVIQPLGITFLGDHAGSIRIKQGKRTEYIILMVRNQHQNQMEMNATWAPALHCPDAQ